jgi:hypothetical protein
VRGYVVRRLVERCLILGLVAVFIWFMLKDWFQSNSINDFGVNVANLEV